MHTGLRRGLGIRAWGLGLILLLLVGCATAVSVPAPSPEPLPTMVAAATPPPTTTPAADATTVPATVAPSPTPTTAPSPTPLPVYTLALPSHLAARLDAAIQTETAVFMPTGSSGPGAELASGSAQVALVTAGSDETAVYQEPLALALPFTFAWENATTAEAAAILADGHNLVTVKPWHTLTAGQKALRVGGLHPLDDGYPLQQGYILRATVDIPLDELAGQLGRLLTLPVVHLAAVGDIMLDRGLGTGLRNGNLDYPFADVAAVLQSADITVGNVESALGDIGQPAAKRYPFRAPPAAAESLARAGFDVVSLANNHAMDYGSDALLQAIDLLQAQGVAPVGAGANAAAARAPHIITANGLRLAFLAYVHVPVEASTHFDTATWTATAATPGLAWAHPADIRADVTAVAPDVDHVIVLLHSGFEYIEEPSQPQVAAAQAAIDAGAALVLGHHAHILQGIEFYGEGVIVYGTGNFAFQIDGSPETAVFHLWLDKNGVRQIEMQPAIVQPSGQPRPAQPAEAAPIRQQVYFLTQILNASQE